MSVLGRACRVCAAVTRAQVRQVGDWCVLSLLMSARQEESTSTAEEALCVWVCGCVHGGVCACMSYVCAGLSCVGVRIGMRS